MYATITLQIIIRTCTKNSLSKVFCNVFKVTTTVMKSKNKFITYNRSTTHIVCSHAATPTMLLNAVSK